MTRRLHTLIGTAIGTTLLGRDYKQPTDLTRSSREVSPKSPKI